MSDLQVIDSITTIVSTYTKVSKKNIYSDCRKKEVTEARNIIMWISRRLYGFTVVEIGSKMNKHHTAVSHACKSVIDWCEYDYEYRLKLKYCLNKVIDNLLFPSYNPKYVRPMVFAIQG